MELFKAGQRAAQVAAAMAACKGKTNIMFGTYLSAAKNAVKQNFAYLIKYFKSAQTIDFV